jgi:hypothetical protein
VLGGVLAIVLVLLAGCGSGEPSVVPSTTVSPTPPPSSGAGPTPTVTIPADGVSLESLGFTNGPVHEFSLPRTALLSATVDQPNNVTAVLSQPPPADVADYLRRALPATGFAITAEEPTALTFTGHGWTGSFTASETTSAILLRPA